MNIKIDTISDKRKFTTIKKNIYGNAYSPMSGEDGCHILNHVDILLGAYVQGRPAGRLAICYGDAYDTLSHFEAKDQWVGSALLRSATGLSLSDKIVLGECIAGGAECKGILEKYAEPPVAFERFNPLWYGRCAVSCGFEREKELYTYTLNLGDVPRCKLKSAADFLTSRHKLYARPMDRENMLEWTDDLYQMLGDEQISRNAFRRYARDMVCLSDGRLGWGVYAERRLVAVVFGIYDYSSMFQDGNIFQKAERMLSFHVKDQKIKFVFHHSIMPGAVAVAYDKLLEELEHRKVKKVYIGEISAKDITSKNTVEGLGAVRDKVYRTYALDKRAYRA